MSQLSWGINAFFIPSTLTSSGFIGFVFPVVGFIVIYRWHSNKTSDVTIQAGGNWVKGLKFAWGDTIREFVHELWKRLIFRRTLASRIRDHLSYYEETDPEENTRTAPPEDETIGLRAIWIAEFYPPSLANSLISALRKLRWDKNDNEIFRENPVAWLQRVRQRQIGETWFNIGRVVRPGDRRWVHYVREAPLPEGIDYASAYIHVISSSLTCFTMGFVLTDEAARVYEECLRTPRKTYARVMGRNIIYHTPANQKSDELEAARKGIRNQCADWFRMHFPGLFAQGLISDEFPSLELLILEKHKPFERGSSLDHDYVRFLKIDRDFDAWEFPTIPGLRVAPLFANEQNELHVIGALRWGDLPKEVDLKPFGGRDIYGLMNFLQEDFSEILKHWGALAVLEGYERMINSVRDAIPYSIPSSKQVLKLMKFLESRIRRSYDISVVSSDLLGYYNRTRTSRQYGNDLRPVHPNAYSKETFIEYIRLMVTNKAKWIRQADERQVAMLGQYATAQSSLVNLRSQRLITLLTWSMAISALLTFAASIISRG